MIIDLNKHLGNKMHKELTIIITGAGIIFLVLISGILAMGETFGQRCAKQHTTQTDIDKCVQDLSKGRK